MPEIPRVVCLKCRIPMRSSKNGVTVEAYSAQGSYYKIMADAWGCPECLYEVIMGFGAGPYTQNYEQGYEAGGTDVSIDLERPTAKDEATVG